MEKRLFWCQNLHKKVKTMLFLQNYALKLFIAFKIFAISALGKALGIFQISSKKRFITSTTGW